MLKNYEFNTRPTDGLIEVRHHDEIKILNEYDRDLVSELYENIRKRFPQAYEDLCNRYQKSIQNIMYFEYRVVCGFIKCNWGVFDNKWDIDDDGNWVFEFIPCPMAGECKSEGRICRAKEKTAILESEMRVLKLIVQGYKVIDIADELYLSPKTVESHVYNMLKKLDLHSNAALVDYWHRHNLK
jgi:DNA-binding CsgD family transcriptional regulator